MFRHIMVPLDGSLFAERALPPAVHLAALTGATVHLVCAVEPPPAHKLVVMTTRGHGALLRWALGSVADRVARHGATAVLVVRAGAAPEPATARM